MIYAVTLVGQRTTAEFLLGFIMNRGHIVLNFLNNTAVDFNAYAEAFQQAAERLTEKLLDSNGYSDADACPIIFLYRHATELYLKTIIIMVSNKSCEHLNHKKTFKEHNLLKLKNILLRLLNDKHSAPIFGELYELFSDNESSTNKKIKYLDTLDERSISFRYPTDNEGEANLPDHFHLVLEDVAQVLSELCDQLSAITFGLSMHEETQIEQKLALEP